MLTLSQLGLLFDISGAIALGLAIAVNRDANIARETALTADKTHLNLRPSLEARHDARFGVLMICLGFSLQFGVPVAIPPACVFAGLAFLVVATGAFWLSRRWMVDRKLTTLQRNG